MCIPHAIVYGMHDVVCIVIPYVGTHDIRIIYWVLLNFQGVPIFTVLFFYLMFSIYQRITTDFGVHDLYFLLLHDKTNSYHTYNTGIKLFKCHLILTRWGGWQTTSLALCHNTGSTPTERNCKVNVLAIYLLCHKCRKSLTWLTYLTLFSSPFIP